jgi:predicted nucleotidyltransferase
MRQQEDAMKKQLAELVERLKAAAGSNLDSVVLYGSAAGDDFHESYSDVNLLCLLRDISGPALKQLAPVIDWWSKKLHHRLPLCMTAEELQTSADVFAIETLDLKHKHRILAGRDFLAEIEVPLDLHRVQLEHELRTLLLRLRQHYLMGPAEEELKKALAKSISTVVTLLRHTLLAVGHRVPAQKPARLSASRSAPSSKPWSCARAAPPALRSSRFISGTWKLSARLRITSIRFRPRPESPGETATSSSGRKGSSERS